MLNMDNFIETSEEGFEGQALYRMPDRVIQGAKKQPFLKDFVVTDLGWFPSASRHRVERKTGLEQHILMVISSGEGWAEWGDQSTTLRAGQALLLSPGTPHCYGSRGQDPWSLYWFHFEGQGAHDLLSCINMKPGECQLSPTQHKSIGTEFQRVLKIVDRGFADNTLMELSKSLIHVLTLIRAQSAARSKGRGADRIEDVISHMKSHLGLNLSLPELASLAGLSVPQFSHLFRQHTGVSPMVYFSELRMQLASTLLDQTNEPIHKVSEKMGFSDPLYFSRQFRKCTGLSPRKYRQRH